MSNEVSAMPATASIKERAKRIVGILEGFRNALRSIRKRHADQIADLNEKAKQSRLEQMRKDIQQS